MPSRTLVAFGLVLLMAGSLAAQTATSDLAVKTRDCLVALALKDNPPNRTKKAQCVTLANQLVTLLQALPPSPPAIGRGPHPSITCPAGAIPITVGSSLQAAVTANGPATFCLKTGVHRRQSARPKDGQAFVGEFGAILDGEHVTPYAFETLSTVPRGVTIRNLTITRYRPPAQLSAIQGDNGRDWIIEHNEVVDNAEHGVRTGTGSIVRRNQIHHNGVIGLSGYRSSNVVIDDNDIHHNPATSFSEVPALAEASNLKMFPAGSLTIRNNDIHDGLRIGIWIDTASDGSTVAIENNRITDQGWIGIWHENSWGATIRGNTVERCGLLRSPHSGWIEGGGIAVSNSAGVTISGNTVRDSLNGIWGMQATGYLANRHLRNLRVEGNTMIRSGQSGIVQNFGDPGVYTSWGNIFVGNRYEFAASNLTPFRWFDWALTEAQWRAAGQDLSGTFTR